MWSNWDETGKTNSSGVKLVKCKHCQSEQLMHSIRCRVHLSKCVKAPENIRSTYTDEESSLHEYQLVRKKTTSQSSLPFKKVKRSSAEEQEEMFVSALITGNVAFSFADNKHLDAFFSKLGVPFRPPSRFVITSRILPSMFAEANIEKNRLLDESPALTLVLDAWTNVRSNGVVNMMICTPEPVFLKSLETEDRHHNADFFTEVISNIIDTKESIKSKLVAIITDNAPVMVRARMAVQNEYPHLLSIGCFAHIINLIMRDYCASPKVTKKEYLCIN